MGNTISCILDASVGGVIDHFRGPAMDIAGLVKVRAYVSEESASVMRKSFVEATRSILPADFGCVRYQGRGFGAHKLESHRR